MPSSVGLLSSLTILLLFALLLSTYAHPLPAKHTSRTKEASDYYVAGGAMMQPLGSANYTPAENVRLNLGLYGAFQLLPCED